MRFPSRSGTLDIDLRRPQVMGVLNITPDSFSDGGVYYRTDSSSSDLARAYDRAQAMVAEGAIFIDVGGESTRPSAAAVSLQEELDRVLPVVEKISANIDCVISVDSSRPEVMRAAAASGAGLLNDVRALQRDGALAAAAETGLPVCLMHMQGQPDSMQDAPRYQNVVDEVAEFFRQRVAQCVAAGIDRDKILVDPGFGFGKTLQHNLMLLKSLQQLAVEDLPLLVGLSRKSMIGAVLDKPVDQRLAGGLALAALAVNNGASIVRTHEVAATCDAVNMAYALRSA